MRCSCVDQVWYGAVRCSKCCTCLTCPTSSVGDCLQAGCRLWMGPLGPFLLRSLLALELESSRYRAVSYRGEEREYIIFCT